MNLESKIFLIIQDRKSGFSLGQLADKYELARSTIQYVITNYRKQHKKRSPKVKISKMTKKNPNCTKSK